MSCKKRMGIMRYLKGRLSIKYMESNRLFAVHLFSAWSGRLLYLQFSKFLITLDCRQNWLADMVTGSTA